MREIQIEAIATRRRDPDAARPRGLQVRLCTALLGMLCVGFASGVASAQADISVAGIHVSQAVQDDANSIPLIAQRSTVVRVSVGVSGTGSPIPNVNGVLHVFVNGSEITPASGLAPINGPITATLFPSLQDENDTLNFELLAPTGIAFSNDVDFVVELDELLGEVDTANNTGSLEDMTFESRCNPTIFYTRVNYTPAGLGLPSPSKIQPGVGDAFVRGIFPFRDDDPDLYKLGLFPALNFSVDDNGDGILTSTPDGAELVSFLDSCRQLIVDLGLGADDKTFLYGWIRDNPTTGNGRATIPGFSAWGNTEDIRSQRTFAHELGHLFGFVHNGRTVDEPGWDVGGRLIGNPATNNTTTRVKDLELNDIMRGGQLTNSAWVDTTNYTAMLANDSVQCLTIDLSRFVAVVSGIMDPSGFELRRLNPIFRYPWASAPTPERFQQGPFTLLLLDENGVVYEQQFDASNFTELPQGEQIEYGTFEVMVPVDPNARIVQMQIVNGQTLLASMQASEAPRIQIVSPQPGASLGTQTVIAVEVDDPDTDLSQMQYNVAYSPDGGQSWVPLAVQVPGEQTQIEVNTTEIQQAEGNGVIRVFVSDGLNTAWADVADLDPEAAIYPPVPEPGFALALACGAAACAAIGRRGRNASA